MQKWKRTGKNSQGVDVSAESLVNKYCRIVFTNVARAWMTWSFYKVYEARRWHSITHSIQTNLFFKL